MSKLKSLIFVVILVLTYATVSNAAGDPANLKIGDKVPDFSTTNYDGNTYSLSLNSGYTVIMFWSCECPYVQPYTSRINALVNEYTSKGVTFWAINSNNNESLERVKEHKSEKQYPFPVLKDNASYIADLFGAQKTPEIFVVDKDLTLVYHGRIDNDKDESKVTSSDLKNALEELLAGKSVTNATTVSFGCGIKR